jgi:signal peptidase II
MIRYWFLVGSILLADQTSKILAVKYLNYGSELPLFPSLNLLLAHNQGAAFGLLAESSGWQRWFFLIFGIVISVFIILWLRKLSPKEHWEKLSLAFILGGAIGNIIDRVYYGYVIDFIDFYIKSWHWYTFNIADSAICIGVTILCLVSLKK